MAVRDIQVLYFKTELKLMYKIGGILMTFVSIFSLAILMFLAIKMNIVFDEKQTVGETIYYENGTIAINGGSFIYKENGEIRTEEKLGYDHDIVVFMVLWLIVAMAIYCFFLLFLWPKFTKKMNTDKFKFAIAPWFTWWRYSKKNKQKATTCMFVMNPVIKVTKKMAEIDKTPIDLEHNVGYGWYVTSGSGRMYRKSIGKKAIWVPVHPETRKRNMDG